MKKKIISLLVVLAMLMAMVPAVFAADGGSIGLGEKTIDADTVYTYTASADETLTIDVTSGTFYFSGTECPISAAYYSNNSLSLKVNGVAQATGTASVTLSAGDSVTIEVVNNTTYMSDIAITAKLDNGSGSDNGEDNTDTPAEPETITVYFRNDWLWPTVYIHWWGSETAADSSWLQVAMTYVETINNVDYYTYTIPADVDGFLFAGYKNGTTSTVQKTWDIKDEYIIDGQCYTIEWDGTDDDGDNYKLVDYTAPSTEPENPLSLGENDLNEQMTYTYVAAETGTLYYKVNEITYTYNGSTDTGDVNWINEWVDLKINGEAVENYYGSVSVTAGDNVTFILVPLDDYVYAANITLSYEDLTPKYGSADLPYDVYSYACPYNIEIGAGETVYANLISFSGYTVTISGGALTASVQYGSTYTGDSSVSFQGGYYSTVAITNNGTAAATYTITATVPLGAMENPAPLVIGTNTCEVAFYGSYYYTYTAPAAGTLTLTPTGENWFFTYNTDAYQYGDNYFASEYTTPVSVPVTLAEGETITVVLATEDYSAGTVSIGAAWAASGSTTPDPDPNPDDGDDDQPTTGTVVAEGTDVPTTDANPVIVEFTASTAGTLTIHIGDKTAFKYIMPGVESLYVKTDKDIELAAGDTITIKIWAYYDWSTQSDNVTYKITFTPNESDTPTEPTKTDYEYSSTTPEITGVGEYDISMEPNTNMTVVEFEPSTTGNYTITATGGEIALIGYNWVNNKIWANITDKTTTIEWTCASVGQSIQIGFASDVTLTITKTEYREPVVTTVIYDNVAIDENTPVFELPEDWVLGDYVDYTKSHTAVLGEDGYYHLDSADGPILLVDMDYIAVLTEKLTSEIPTMVIYSEKDENGDYTKTNIAPAILEYYGGTDYSSEGYETYEGVVDANGYYPLTEDLMYFYQNFPDYGFYMFYLEDYDANNTEATWWMYACRTVDSGIPETGDSSMLSVAIAAALVSAMSVVALPIVKKHF